MPFAIAAAAAEETTTQRKTHFLANL